MAMLPVVSLSAQEKLLKIGYFTCPPHIYNNAGDAKPVGAAVDYWESVVAKKMNSKIEWVGPLPFSRYLTMLESGEIDVAVVLGKNAARQEFGYYSEGELYQAQSTILVLNDSVVKKVSDVNDIISLKIGYAQGQMISPLMQDKRIKWDMISASDWIEPNFQKLQLKRVDALFFIEGFVAQFNLKKDKLNEKIRLIPLPEATNPMFSVFSKKSVIAKEIFDKYNQIQKEQNKLNTYMTFLKRYIE